MTLLNRVIYGQYMSASTIKPLSALAGLEYGIYSDTRTTNCTGYWTGDGEAYGYRNGVVSLGEWLRESFMFALPSRLLCKACAQWEKNNSEEV